MENLHKVTPCKSTKTLYVPNTYYSSGRLSTIGNLSNYIPNALIPQLFKAVFTPPPGSSKVGVLVVELLICFDCHLRKFQGMQTQANT